LEPERRGILSRLFVILVIWHGERSRLEFNDILLDLLELGRVAPLLSPVTADALAGTSTDSLELHEWVSVC
jgi:hypothetical protein